MRRLILVVTLAILAALGTQVLPTHAQTYTTNPTVTATPSTVTFGSTSTIQGTGFTPNYYAYLYYQRPDGTSNAFYVTTGPSGTFTQNLGFSASHGTGNEFVSAYDFGTQRWAPFVVITVNGTVAPPPTTEQITASPNPVGAGQTTIVSGSGFSPNNYVYFYYQRPDGTANAFYVYTTANGTFSQQLGFLASHGCGAETIQTYDYGTGTYSTPYTITVNGC